ncbi:tRNA(Ile2)-agmatinylcytidine synthase [Halohasta litchfieldiae]|jgi:tRNA(Ile2)-agmatinylcytidine synthase|uniref:tRNA(Ile2) 2-agmatinylcytidine synthetase TiaS n=1 Tax=Halohasta litchfieldiae TaxID=1073996 RepID=A0A1H6TTI5_9EURY|nr:tRNA(Ile)(2)-agmatinylcytidine synthase [Halohasta litchfieldiae]ATW88849.1 tRNA(Ile2)-agmatinylcytidine synthase [Halohasta litchfieldiae]SEI79515.1 tRNA(Ile2) 2-agmatinylcytidine synthetase [Halohasta litchfieldiae]
MTVIGLDDTDSRSEGMCTTYLATRLAEAIEATGGTVQRRLLVRLNPAVKHKTRGNAALALHTDLDAETAFELACDQLESLAIDVDSRTSPGVVVATGSPEAVPDSVSNHARRAIRHRISLDDAIAVSDDAGYHHRGWAGVGCDVQGRGRIGALAAVGAWQAFDEWTYETISYREFDRCGTPREVDTEAVFAAAESGYPTVWDTVDRGTGETVCVPNAPGPILYGIRGDEPAAVREVAADIAAADGTERVDRTATFLTNQGTDSHLADGAISSLREGAGYRVDGVVDSEPETRQGGHVFFRLADTDQAEPATVDCVAFEPTKRFRDYVRNLRVGDRLTVCGEYSDGTIKLEKIAVRTLNRTEQVTPECPDCGRRMKSAGRNQGYRCRDCGTSAPGKVAREVDRDLDLGWYEVPPAARRHIATPLVRGEFDGPTHPER